MTLTPNSSQASTGRPINWSLLSTQAVDQPGLINLGYGYPDPALLPTDAMTRGTQTTIAKMGSRALEYGANAGPAPLLAHVRAHLAQIGEGDIAPNEIMITNGNSHALNLLAALFMRPGNVMLVESPTYHLALRLLRDHPVELVAAPGDADGIDVMKLTTLVQRLKREGKTVRALYCVPTFNNPTGVSLPDARRRQLVAWAANEDVLIFEDDVYRELAYDAPAPPSLWSIAPRGSVVARMGSFAKTLAPGLRLGYLTASEPVITRSVECGLIDSAGGIAHFVGCCVAGLFENGDYASQVERLRSAYRSRRDALITALREHLPPTCEWRVPGGGFFVWVQLPDGIDSATLLAEATKLGVAFVPGHKFFSDDGGAGYMRLAFTLYDEARLAEAAWRLGQAIRVMSAA